MKLQMSYRFEVFGAYVQRDRSQHEVSLGRDSVKNPEETESWCTTVTKKRASRFSDTQRTQTMHLQFLESEHGEEMADGCDKRVDACLEHYGLWSCSERDTFHNLPAHSID